MWEGAAVLSSLRFGCVVLAGGPLVHEGVELGFVLRGAQALQKTLEAVLLFLQAAQGIGLVGVKSGVACGAVHGEP